MKVELFFLMSVLISEKIGEFPKMVNPCFNKKQLLNVIKNTILIHFEVHSVHNN